MKKTVSIILSVLTAVSMCACGNGKPNGDVSGASSSSDTAGVTGAYVSEDTPFETLGEDASKVDDIISEFLTQAESESIAPEAKEGGVRLLGDKIEYDGIGITVDGQTATVNKAGTYSFSGTLDDGQIIVDVPKTEKVTLILNGVSVSCSDSAPVYVKCCDRVTVTLAEGTVNTLSDGNEYVYASSTEDEPNAALYSADDMTVNGKGALIVKGNYNNGISTKNDLKIEDATVTVTSKHDGIRGKDSVCIKSGTVNVSSGGDGIKSNNAEEEGRGYVTLEGGTLNISASEDGIQAETALTVSGGEIRIKTGAGSGSSWSGSAYGNASEASAKALKASVSVNVSGGIISVDSADDAVHSNKDVVISGGNIEASSGDDGIHADETLEISGGNITIQKSYEGLESVTIRISGGNVHVKASDDGINGAGGNDGSAVGGRPGAWGGMGGASNSSITISGGNLYFNADGDGLDANGSFTITGGTVIVDGPTNGGNGPLDYDSSFTVSGGLLIATGSSGMAQNVSSSSTQCTVLAYVQGQGGEIFNISSDGESVITYKPSKKYECVLVSSPNLEKGKEYTVSVGGSCTGDSTDGLFAGGEYTGGTVKQTYTHSSVVSTAGTGGGFGGGPGGMPGGMGGGARPSKPSGGRQPTI